MHFLNLSEHLPDGTRRFAGTSCSMHDLDLVFGCVMDALHGPELAEGVQKLAAATGVDVQLLT